MNIRQLLESADRRLLALSPEVDALTDDGALDDAALVAFDLNGIEGSATMLFDCRGALELPTGNAAIVVLRRVFAVTWQAPAPRGRAFRRVGVWRTTVVTHGVIRLLAEFETGEDLEITGSGAEFYVGDVPDGESGAVEYLGTSEREVRERSPSWDTNFTPLYATFLD